MGSPRFKVMPVQIIAIIVLSLVAGYLYRRGGTSKGTKWRDLGIPCVVIVSILLLGLKTPWWTYFAQFGLLFGALTAYWGLDEEKWGYWAHGLGISVSAIPIAYTTGHWVGFGLRCVILTALITIWSEFVKWDVLEEWGRGIFIILTLPLLLI